MKSPHHRLKLLPLAIIGPILLSKIGLQLLGLQWPWFDKVLGIIARPLLVAVIALCVLVLFLELRWRARQKGPARLSACHACGYELTGNTHQGRCPECNAAFKTP